ncbi:MAG: glycosyltransferase family 4 protein [Pseudohongiella sp.]|nr:glycosyltransferase family 4 protein [Pseudohongiella sp.]
MKLALLIYKYFPYGGQQRDFMRILQRCQQAGHDVVVYCLSWQGPQPDNIELVIVPVKAFSRHLLYQRYTAWIQSELGKHSADLVIGFSKMPGLDIYYAADPCFAARMDRENSLIKKILPRYRHFLRYEKAVLDAGSDTEIMLLSPQQQNDFEEFYPGCKPRLHQLSPGIDASRLPSAEAETERKEFRENFSLTDNDIALLQIGSGFKVKGLDRSIRAFAALPDDIRLRSQFYIVGQDKPGDYLKLAQSLRVADRCHFLGGREDVPLFLRGCDLLLHPAYSESAGYTLLEAVINGLPVLTTDTCGYAFHVERARAGEVCKSPFSQQELNNMLLSMLETLNQRKWQQNGLAYAKQIDVAGMPDAALKLIEQVARKKTSVLS